MEFDSNVDIFPDSNLKSSLTDSIVEQESVGKESNISLEDTSDKVIPEDVSLPSQFLLPNLDDSSSDEETRITELNTEVELNGYDKGKEMQNVTGQDNIDRKSESQFSSFMSYHEGESSSMDPSTNEQEFSKSPIVGSAQRHDSGVDNQEDISSHDSDMIAYESNETSSPSIEVSFPSDSVSKSEIITENNSVDPTMEVEVVPLRRSARHRKQTQLFGNPWLYRITYNLTPRVLSDLLHHVPDTMDSLTDKNIDTMELEYSLFICIILFLTICIY